jgi:hypothetical protein
MWAVDAGPRTRRGPAVGLPRLPVVPRNTKRLELDPSITPEQIEEYLALKRRVEEKRLREERERQEERRTRLRDAYRGPLDLLIAMHPDWKRTPALEVVSEAFEETVSTPGARVIVTMSPQEGKSQSVQAASLRALQHNPDCRIAYASYAEWLARRNAGEVRDLINEHGSDAKDSVTGDPLPDLLGIALNPDRAAEGRWQLGHGHHGSAVAVGLTSGLTGAAVDLLVVDDPVKDQQAADSETIRSRLHDWWAAVAETRLAPHTSIIVIQTRWHPDDLAGRLISEDMILPEDQRQWQVINIPALADGQTPDALEGIDGGRDEHGWMISARGNRVPMWTSIQAKRPRVFAAMYMGRPVPAEGGIFQAAWFDDNRVFERPPVVIDRVVGVDPADTGTGDAAGILIAEVGSDGHSYWIADLSGQLSQAEWARRVCLAWLRYECLRIVQERNLGMRTSVKDAWSLLHRQAVALTAFGGVEEAAQALIERGDRAAADVVGLREIEDDAEAIVEAGENGPRVDTMNPKVSKQQRAESATQPFQEGRAHIVGHLPALEYEATGWQIGQKSPNRLDTLSMLVAHFSRITGRSRVLV